MNNKKTTDNQSSQKEEVVSGVVIEALPNTLFKIKFNDGREILSYLSGKMRLHRIRVMVGDKVDVVLDEYGNRGRIVRRF